MIQRVERFAGLPARYLVPVLVASVSLQVAVVGMYWDVGYHIDHGRDQGAPAPGWVRFDMLRGVQDENEVVTFGFFDGTLDELESSQEGAGYQERVDAIAEFVDAVVANGVYEIVVDWTA